jgi:hypothetical protein
MAPQMNRPTAALPVRRTMTATTIRARRPSEKKTSHELARGGGRAQPRTNVERRLVAGNPDRSGRLSFALLRTQAMAVLRIQFGDRIPTTPSHPRCTGKCAGAQQTVLVLIDALAPITFAAVLAARSWRTGFALEARCLGRLATRPTTRLSVRGESDAYILRSQLPNRSRPIANSVGCYVHSGPR